MTNLFQPLDLTINRSIKTFIKYKFTKWYSLQVTKQLNSGKRCEEVQVKLLLSTLKLLLANWVLKLYNYLISTSGKEFIANGWKAAEITNAIKKVLPLSRSPTLFPASTLFTNKLKITSTTIKQNILMQKG